MKEGSPMKLQAFKEMIDVVTLAQRRNHTKQRDIGGVKLTIVINEDYASVDTDYMRPEIVTALIKAGYETHIGPEGATVFKHETEA